MEDKTYSVADAANKLKVAAVTLRLWERLGKIPPARRSGGNQRYYLQADLDQIQQFINSKIPSISPLPQPVSNLDFVSQALSTPILSPLQKKVLASVFLVLSIAGGGAALAKSGIFAKPLISKIQDLKSENSQGAVLASESVNDDYRLSVNVPALFAKDITAPNVIYSLTAGDNVTITGGQNPTISVDSQTTDLKIFKTVKVGSTEIGAGTNADTLELAAGDNVSLSTSGKKITIASTTTTPGVTGGGTGQTSWTTGDILYASATNTLAKLNVGTASQVLTVSGGLPVWAAAASGGWTSSSGSVYPTTTSDKVIIGGNTSTSHLLEVSGAITGKALVSLNETGGQNILVASASGTNKLTLSSAGDLSVAGDITAANFVIASGSGTSGFWQRNSGVLSPTTASDNISLAGRFLSSLIPDTGSSYDLGSSTRRWSTVYGDTGNFTNLTASNLSVSGTTAEDFLINSDYTGNDAQDSSLTFERGAPATNAQLKWNSGTTAKYISANTPFFVNPDTGISSGGTAALIVNQPFAADILTASASGVTVLTLSNSGDLTISGNLIGSSSGASGHFQRNSGVVSPTNVTDDLILGGSATASAKFQISGTTGNASSSGNLAFSTPATIAGTAMQSLTLGDAATGNLVLAAGGTVNSGSTIYLTNAASTTLGTFVSGQFSMNSNAFTYRRTLTVTNNDGSATLPINYEVTVTITGANAAQIFSNTQADCDDLRIAYNSTEIARNISSCTASNIAFSYQLQATISPSSSSSAYYLYYNNTSLPAGSTFTSIPNVQLDSSDVVANWTSNNGGYPLAQETTIKQEGTGSVKQGPTTLINNSPGDAMTFSSSGQGQLPLALENHSSASIAIGGTTYVYTIGGNSSITTIYKNSIASGNLGTWTNSGQGTLPVGLTVPGAIALTINGSNFLYVIGGSNSGAGVSTVYRASIDSSGNIGTLSTTNQTQLPVAFGSPTILYANVGGTDYLYLFGVKYLGGSGDSSVYRTTIDSSGNIGAWTTSGQTQLPFGENGTSLPMQLVNIGGTNYIYLIGGNNYSNSASSRVSRSSLDSSGNVGAWSTTNQTQLSTTWREHALLSSTIDGSNYLYILGGSTNGGTPFSNSAQKATIDSSGNVGSFSTTNQGVMHFSAGSKNSRGLVNATGTTNYIYVFGTGHVPSALVERAQIYDSSTAYTATKTISSTDLSDKSYLLFWFRSSRTGAYMKIEFSEDGSTWQSSSPFTVSSANTWEVKSWDISGISSAAKNAVTQIRFKVTDATSAFTAYFDDIQASAYNFLGTAPSTSSGAATLGTSNLALNAQGSGAVRVNFDSSNLLAGTGGWALYDGGTTLVYSIDGSGNASGSGNLTFAGAKAIQTTGNNTLTIGGSTTGRILFDDVNLSSAVPLSLSTSALNANLTQGLVDAINDIYTISSGGSGSSGFWQLNNKVISPSNSTFDLAIGGTATSSAKFQVLGSTGSATTSGNLTFNSAATIATTAKQTLTVGDANTGNVVINGGNVGVGNTAPLSKLDVSGAVTGKALVALNETGDQDILVASASGTNRLTLSNAGNLTITGNITAANFIPGGGGGGSGTAGFIQRNSGALSPTNLTDDLLVGGTATASAAVRLSAMENDIMLNGKIALKTDDTNLANSNAIFAYDTSTDLDGGTWTTGASSQASSWYNETLDATGPACSLTSDDRCGTRAFPKRAVITATNSTLLIHDATDNTLWMKFSRGTGYGINGTSVTLTSVFALNGIIYVGTSTNGLLAIDLINDRIYQYDYNAGSGGKAAFQGTITNRNTNKGYGTRASWGQIASDQVADVFARNINGKTYIGVSTLGGISVINTSDSRVVRYID